MNKIILLILISGSIAYGQKSSKYSDSLKAVDIEKRFSVIEVKNRILEEKINTLNTTNDKIFTAFYTLLGILVAAVIAAGVWNSIQNWKLNNERLLNIKDTLHKEIEQSLKISIDNNLFSILKKVDAKVDFSKIDFDILGIKALFLRHLIISYDFYNAKPDMNIEYAVLCELLTITIEREKINPIHVYGEIEDVLKAILAYLNKGHTMGSDELERFYSTISLVPAGRYDLYLNKIKKHLNI